LSASRVDATATDVANLTGRTIGAREATDVVAAVRLLVAGLTSFTGRRAVRAAPLRELAEFQAVAEHAVVAISVARALGYDAIAGRWQAASARRAIDRRVSAGRVGALVGRTYIAVVAIRVRHALRLGRNWLGQIYTARRHEEQNHNRDKGHSHC